MFMDAPLKGDIRGLHTMGPRSHLTRPARVTKQTGRQQQAPGVENLYTESLQ